jgi:cytohesin
MQIQNAEGKNALEIAIINGHDDTIHLLLQTLGGNNYPLTSVSLEIASARKLETMRSLMKTASIMYAHVKSKSENPEEYAWMEWVLRTGGILIKPKAMFNMMNIAISDGHLALVEALLRNGADSNMYLWSGPLPLNIAVLNRDLEMVKLLLDHGADPVVSASIVKRPPGPTKDVLLDALSNMEYDKDTCIAILERLLRSGRFNVLFGSASNQTAFWKVLESNHWDKDLRDQVLRMMLDTVSDINYSCCSDGATLLHHVVRFGEKVLVDVLLEKGASMNARDNERRTPIMIACHFQPTMITFLLERGADLSLRYGDGKGPLHSAATAGNLEALKILTTLDNGVANIEQTSKEGWTPLAYALASGHEEAALFLIGQGANLNHTVGKFGWSMLHLAAAFGHELVFDMIMALSHENIHMRDTLKNATPLLLVRIPPLKLRAVSRH